jgi:hypothetical protein
VRFPLSVARGTSANLLCSDIGNQGHPEWSSRLTTVSDTRIKSSLITSIAPFQTLLCDPSQPERQAGHGTSSSFVSYFGVTAPGGPAPDPRSEASQYITQHHETTATIQETLVDNHP